MSKNMLENIRAVIFDLDGTLVDSMWMWVILLDSPTQLRVLKQKAK